MSTTDQAPTLNAESLKKIFPPEKADQFFEALFGDSSEGSFDIELGFLGRKENVLELEFRLQQRPGKCLACNLTYGLPQVFSRHPVIDLAGVAQQVAVLAGKTEVKDWKLGKTQQASNELHVIPLTIILDQR